MNNFIEKTREDGTIEYVNPNYDELYALAEAAKVEAANYNHELIISAEELAASELRGLRRLRDQKIAETDWWANSDLTMTQAQTDYRQALRDITETYSSYLDVVWPVKPS
jgi:transcriptional regulator with XRE-family HTH domain|tara:strand:- start:21 stop:350 length:330 start_codon:yes stop_codon:yes gene_type:complete